MPSEFYKSELQLAQHGIMKANLPKIKIEDVFCDENVLIEDDSSPFSSSPFRKAEYPFADDGVADIGPAKAMARSLPSNVMMQKEKNPIVGDDTNMPAKAIRSSYAEISSASPSKTPIVTTPVEVRRIVGEFTSQIKGEIKGEMMAGITLEIREEIKREMKGEMMAELINNLREGIKKDLMADFCKMKKDLTDE